MTSITTLTSILAGAILAGPTLMAAPAQPTADRLLQQMKTDAQTIESHATKLARLTEDTNTRWGQFDEQWNEIKPAQEELQMKLNRLEGMRASLTDQQRKELDESKTAVQQVSALTHDLLKLIDKPGMDLTSRQFRSQARALANSASIVARSS